MNIEMAMALITTRAVEGAMVVNNCHQCKHRREVPGSCHSQCVMPSLGMTGSPHGIKRGWFMYPLNFDPVWMTAKCGNFEAINGVSLAGNSSGKPA